MIVVGLYEKIVFLIGVSIVALFFLVSMNTVVSNWV